MEWKLRKEIRSGMAVTFDSLTPTSDLESPIKLMCFWTVGGNWSIWRQQPTALCLQILGLLYNICQLSHPVTNVGTKISQQLKDIQCIQTLCF